MGHLFFSGVIWPFFRTIVFCTESEGKFTLMSCEQVVRWIIPMGLPFPVVGFLIKILIVCFMCKVKNLLSCSNKVPTVFCVAFWLSELHLRRNDLLSGRQPVFYRRDFSFAV